MYSMEESDTEIYM